jgi:hypothetical protein
MSALVVAAQAVQITSSMNVSQSMAHFISSKGGPQIEATLQGFAGFIGVVATTVFVGYEGLALGMIAGSLDLLIRNVAMTGTGEQRKRILTSAFILTMTATISKVALPSLIAVANPTRALTAAMVAGLYCAAIHAKWVYHSRFLSHIANIREAIPLRNRENMIQGLAATALAGAAGLFVSSVNPVAIGLGMGLGVVGIMQSVSQHH